MNAASMSRSHPILSRYVPRDDATPDLMRHFAFLSEATQCCRSPRFKISRTECMTLGQCAEQCARSHDCRYLSFSEDWGGICYLCTGCEVETGPWMLGHGQLLGLFHAYARVDGGGSTSTEELTRESDTSAAAEAENATYADTSCRAVPVAAPSSSRVGRSQCRYKIGGTAGLSAGGHAWEYFHFLVDFAPRVFAALSRDGCHEATLLLPDFGDAAHKFRLTETRDAASSHGWVLRDGEAAAAGVEAAAPPAIISTANEAVAIAAAAAATAAAITAAASDNTLLTVATHRHRQAPPAQPASLSTVAAALFGSRALPPLPHLRIVWVRTAEELCRAHAQLLPFAEWRLQWGARSQ